MPLPTRSFNDPNQSRIEFFKVVYSEEYSVSEFVTNIVRCKISALPQSYRLVQQLDEALDEDKTLEGLELTRCSMTAPKMDLLHRVLTRVIKYEYAGEQFML
jgi:hypothetical protein